MATESTPFPTSGSPTLGSGGTTGNPGTDSGGIAEGMSTAADDGSFRAPQGTGTAGNSDLMRKVVQGAHATIDRLADKAAPAVDRLQSTVSGASEKMHASADHVREVGDEWAESLRITVRENPLTAIAVALAAGLLIARLGSRD